MLVLKSLITLTLLLLHVHATASPDPQWNWQSQSYAPSRPNNNYSPPKATGGWNGPNVQQPNARPTASPKPRDDPDEDDEPKWTPPPQWGPKGTKPFGPRTTTIFAGPTPTAGGRRTTKAPAPKVTSYNSDQIPTTTPELPKEPVPFVATCGKKRYDEYDVSNALTAGCFYFKKGTKISNTEFPKVFVNNQRFDFGSLKGTLYEFPLIESAPYVNGDPGLDRVVFSTPECYLAGELTMQGQAVGRYTECSEEY